MVAGGRRHGDVHECVAALLIEPVPLLIVAVVDEVARVHEKLRVGADLHRGALNGAALREVYFVARLNIGKGYERKTALRRREAVSNVPLLLQMPVEASPTL